MPNETPKTRIRRSEADKAQAVLDTATRALARLEKRQEELSVELTDVVAAVSRAKARVAYLEANPALKEVSAPVQDAVNTSDDAHHVVGGSPGGDPFQF